MRFTRVLLGIVLSVPVLAGCAPTTLNLPTLSRTTTPRGPLTPRPPGTPDVVILAVSGRCAVPCLGAPNANREYLSARGSLDVIADALRARGLRVRVQTYAAHPAARYVSTISGREERGFAQLDADLQDLHADLVRGRRDPARLVLVGHSHGVTWTRNLARLHPDVTFDVAIDLDGVCSLWERDNAPELRALDGAPGGPRWPIELRTSCRPIRVGRQFVHLKDIALDNISHNLEVQSGRVLPPPPAQGQPNQANYFYDGIRNRRPDASTRGVQTHVAFGENHSTVSLGTSHAMGWVVARLLELPLWDSPAPRAPGLDTR